jgi:hypothetical protein
MECGFLKKACRAAAVLRQFVLWRTPTWLKCSVRKSCAVWYFHQKVKSVILPCQNYAWVHSRWECRILNISEGYYTLSYQTLISSTLQEMHMKNSIEADSTYVSVLFCFVSLSYVSWLLTCNTLIHLTCGWKNKLKRNLCT